MDEHTKREFKLIRDMCSSLLSAQRTSDDIPKIPLDGLLTVLENHIPRIGILCDSGECKFNTGTWGCCFKQVILREGKCNLYRKENPEDILEDDD